MEKINNLNFEQYFMAKGDTSFVAKIFLYNRDKCLILQKPTKKWQLPGGHIKFKETVKQGLKREVYEETGISDFSFTAIKKNGNLYLFKGVTNVSDVKLSEEHIAYKWINVEELSKYKLTNSTFTQLNYV